MKVFVKVSGGKHHRIKDQEFCWSGNDADALFSWATNYAEGYVMGLISGKHGLTLYHPMVMQVDGYHWWEKEGDFSVKVVNENGETVRTSKDIK